MTKTCGTCFTRQKDHFLMTILKQKSRLIVLKQTIEWFWRLYGIDFIRFVIVQ